MYDKWRNFLTDLKFSRNFVPIFVDLEGRENDKNARVTE